MVKPSEVCVHTAKVMEELLPVYLDKVLVSVSSLPQSPSVFHSFSMDSFEWGLLWPPHTNPVQPTLEYGPSTYGYNCNLYLFLLVMGPLDVARAQGPQAESDRLQVNLN